MIRILLIIYIGVLLPTASAAQQMSSENFSIDLERSATVGDGIPSSANFNLSDAFGELISSDSVLPAPTPTPTPTPPPDGGGGASGRVGDGDLFALESTPIPTPTPSITACNGADFNGDGVVDLVDFGTLVFFWGVSNPANSCVDINGNGNVGLVDFGVLVFEWTSTL